jgi:FdhE protein
VASGFFRKLLGARPVVPAHLAGPLAELDKLAKQQPALQPACSVLATALPALFTEAVTETAPTPGAEKVRDKLLGGVPLLRGEAVAWDRPSLDRRWLAVCAAVANHQQSDAAGKLGQAIQALEPATLLTEVLAGRPDTVAGKAEALALDAGLAATVLRLSALPVLAHIAEQLSGPGREVAWDVGCCPVCGSHPLLGEFRGLEQLRWLRCGWCASAWEFPRLRCPFCDNRDHRSLGYFHIEGEENRYRAATCDACQGFVKMVSTLSPLSAVQLLVADVATLPLDLAAADRGFVLR